MQIYDDVDVDVASVFIIIIIIRKSNASHNTKNTTQGFVREREKKGNFLVFSFFIDEAEN